MLDVDDRPAQCTRLVEHAARFDQCGFDAGKLHDALAVGVLAIDHHQCGVGKRARLVAQAHQVAQRRQ